MHNATRAGQAGRSRPAPRSGRTSDQPSPELRRTLIVGAGSGGEYIARELREHRQWKLWPVGFVDDDRAKLGDEVQQLPVLGDSSAIPAIADRERIDVIVLAMPSAPRARLDHIASIAKSTRADVVTMPSISSILSGEQRAESLHQVRMKDVLSRPIVEPDRQRCLDFVRDRRVLITGAAGSIGHELAVQVAGLQPASVTLLDTNESDLYDLQQEILLDDAGASVRGVIASVTDEQRIDDLLGDLRPQIVFHAAAYKHVPLMEMYPGEALRTNVFGSRNVARAAARHGASRFVQVSTDKAVRPTSVMGATKRMAEIVLANIARQTGLSTCSVRFGNVLGSRGSVIPTFERQIRAGGPVTVTDARMRRYFMTIPEAASLIIQSGAFGERNAICILDMGEDVSILELAERVIELHGLRPYIDIPIEFTGMRPGEKLHEDLAHDFEMAHPSPHQKIRTLQGSDGTTAIDDLDRRLQALEHLARDGNAGDVRDTLLELVRLVDYHEEYHGYHAATASA